MSASILAIQDLCVSQGGCPELEHLTLALEAGETLTVLGEAGCGKEALLRVLGGFPARADQVSGTLAFGGGEPRPASRASRRARPLRMAWLPGPFSRPFSPHATVLSQLSRAIARRLGMPVAGGREELRARIAALEGAPPFPAFDRKPGALGAAGMAWGLLAAALAETPELILADDPFADLDPTVQCALLKALERERARLGAALLYATGGLLPAVHLGSRVVVLRQGRAVEEGQVARLASGQAHAYTNTLFRALPRLAARKPQPKHVRGEPLLQVHGLDLDKASRGGLSFELRRGAALALVGEEGSGRRALMRAVLGLDRVGRGRVVLDAVDPGALSATMAQRFRRRLAFVTGTDAALDPRMTLWDTVDEPLRAHLGLTPDLIGDYREAALKRVGLASLDGARRVADLSPFDKRRLQVARAIVAAPLLCVIDEPLRGLDAFAQSVLREVLTDFRTQEGAAFLVITADFTVAEALAEDAFVMHAGKVVERGAIRDILADPQDPATRKLIAAVTLPHLSQSAVAG